MLLSSAKYESRSVDFITVIYSLRTSSLMYALLQDLRNMIHVFNKYL
jgi:hypothetical protein